MFTTVIVIVIGFVIVIVVVVVVVSFIQVSGRLYVKKRVASKEQYILSFNLRKMFCFVFCFVLFLCRERKLYSWNSNGKSSVVPSTHCYSMHLHSIPSYTLSQSSITTKEQRPVYTGDFSRDFCCDFQRDFEAMQTTSDSAAN